MQNILVRHGERQRRSHQKANRTHKKTHLRSFNNYPISK